MTYKNDPVLHAEFVHLWEICAHRLIEDIDSLNPSVFTVAMVRLDFTITGGELKQKLLSEIDGYENHYVVLDQVVDGSK